MECITCESGLQLPWTLLFLGFESLIFPFVFLLSCTLLCSVTQFSFIYGRNFVKAVHLPPKINPKVDAEDT